MPGALEVDELAFVAFATVVLQKFGDVLEGGDPVVAAMQEEAGGEVFGWKLATGAAFFRFLVGGETVVLDALGGCIDDGGVGGDGCGLEVEALGVFLVTLQGCGEGKVPPEPAPTTMIRSGSMPMMPAFCLRKPMAMRTSSIDSKGLVRCLLKTRYSMVTATQPRVEK